MRNDEKRDIEISLRLRDRRGRGIRAALCEGLRIKVWTQDPRYFLSYHLRDILQTEEEDILRIPDFEMDTLPPGVIAYRYTFFEHHSETADTVITDIKWRGGRPLDRPGHHHGPEHFNELGRITELLEDLDHKLSEKVRGLYNYIQREYPEEISAERERAVEAESRLNKKINEAGAAIRNEANRAKGIEGNLKKSLQDLQKSFDEFKSSYDESQQSGAAAKEKEKAELEKRFSSVMNALDEFKKSVATEIREIKEKAKAHVTRLDARIDDALDKKILRDAELKSLITTEKDRAKSVEKTLKTALDTETDRAKSAESILESKISDNKGRINDEVSRAKLVEKDITEALQRLKQSVADNRSTGESAVTLLRQELIDRIDYRIREIVGAAPEALDTLEEVAARLKSDDDALKALNSILSEKANSDDVYKKTKIDEFLLEIRNLVTAETQRAKLAEKANADAIEVINGDENTIGSIRHAVEDAKHYADDAVHALDDRIEPVGLSVIQGWFRKG